MEEGRKSERVPSLLKAGKISKSTNPELFVSLQQKRDEGIFPSVIGKREHARFMKIREVLHEHHHKFCKRYSSF